MIDSSQIFREQFALLKNSQSLVESARNLATTSNDRVTNKATLTSLQGPVVYTFAKDVFESGIEKLMDTQSGKFGITEFVEAWASAADVSVMLVSPGVSIGAPSPATTFSVISSTTLDPPSLIAAKQVFVNMLLASSPVKLDINSNFGPSMWSAFTTLTYTVIGLDSTPSPDGPFPLEAPTLPLI